MSSRYRLAKWVLIILLGLILLAVYPLGPPFWDLKASVAAPMMAVIAAAALMVGGLPGGVYSYPTARVIAVLAGLLSAFFWLGGAIQPDDSTLYMTLTVNGLVVVTYAGASLWMAESLRNMIESGKLRVWVAFSAIPLFFVVASTAEFVLRGILA